MPSQKLKQAFHTCCAFTIQYINSNKKTNSQHIAESYPLLIFYSKQMKITLKCIEKIFKSPYLDLSNKKLPLENSSGSKDYLNN